jgi:membrane protein YqaA with SNARE-associated domain
MDMNFLAEYVSSRIRAGVSRAVVCEELLAVGWSEEEADAAYRAGLVACGIPVPSEGNRPTLSQKSSTVDIVINFFAFILLGIVATALGTLLFQVISKYFPDALDTMGWYTDASITSTIHYSIAALLIGFPLYYFAMRLWFRKFREDEGRVESRLSKWLTYLVLLITAVTIVGDLITVVFTLLQGEITTRFFLKALTILVIAGIIFGFYYLERRKIQYHLEIPRTTFQYFGRGVTLLVVFAIVSGFFASGSPATERNRTFDRTRVEHLSSLSDCIESYARTLGQLPTSFTTLKQSSQFSYCASYMQDPETKATYSYRVVTPSRMDGAARVGEFELCATFSLASQDGATGMAGYGSDPLWSEHSAGISCDTVTAQLVLPVYPDQQPVPNYNYVK